MNQAEIIKMAAEIWNAGSSFPIPSSDDILHFAKLVAAKAEAKEREACAKVLDDIQARCIAKDIDDPPLDMVAEAIRARGQA